MVIARSGATQGSSARLAVNGGTPSPTGYLHETGEGQSSFLPVTLLRCCSSGSVTYALDANVSATYIEATGWSAPSNAVRLMTPAADAVAGFFCPMPPRHAGVDDGRQLGR
jgi:hypothetical protein